MIEIFNRIPLVKKLEGNRLQERIYKEYIRAKLLQKNESEPLVVIPDGYGRGLPERVIELLYAATLYYPNAKVLDIGHSNSMICHRKMIYTLPKPWNFTGIDIATPVYDVNKIYKKSVICDIADAPFAKDEFDLIWCISAMEHFGKDNSSYLNDFKIVNRLDFLATKKMLQLLKPTGKMLITVPYGKFEDHKWLINYDSDYLKPILDLIAECADFNCYYYRHTYGKGWSEAVPEELKYVGYYDQRNAGCGALAVIVAQKR